MIKELLKIANYINDLEEENSELKVEVQNLQEDCREWQEMYDELKNRNQGK